MYHRQQAYKSSGQDMIQRCYDLKYGVVFMMEEWFTIVLDACLSDLQKEVCESDVTITIPKTKMVADKTEDTFLKPWTFSKCPWEQLLWL